MTWRSWWMDQREKETIHPQKCWCGGRVGLRDNGGLGCLDSAYHDWQATGRPSRVTLLYIAGPMTGYADCNYPAFDAAAVQLRDIGYDVVSPAEFGNGRHYVDFIREDLHHMLDCHAVATLENWWESVGARNEVQVAGILRMPVRTVEEWISRGPE